MRYWFNGPYAGNRQFCERRVKTADRLVCKPVRLEWNNLQKTITKVALAYIFDAEDRVLIAKRPQSKHMGGFWEFPGGKVEVGENPEAALARELFEEVDIHVTSAQPYMRVEHDYVDKKVLLDIWQVDAFSGKAQNKEGQQCRWLSLEQILAPSGDNDLCFPAGNQPILQRLAEQGLKQPRHLSL